MTQWEKASFAGMDTSTIAKTAYHLEIDGWRPHGQPKQRWQETVNKDIQIVSLRPRSGKLAFQDLKSGSH